MLFPARFEPASHLAGETVVRSAAIQTEYGPNILCYIYFLFVNKYTCKQTFLYFLYIESRYTQIYWAKTLPKSNYAGYLFIYFLSFKGFLVDREYFSVQLYVNFQSIRPHLNLFFYNVRRWPFRCTQVFQRCGGPDYEFTSSLVKLTRLISLSCVLLKLFQNIDRH